MVSHSGFIFATWVAAVFGGIGIAAAFLSAIVGYQLTEQALSDANEKITIAREEARAEVAKAHAEAAKANARTAEIYEKFSARRINAEQRGKLVRSLKEAAFKVRVTYQPESEVIDLSNDLAVALSEAEALDGREVAGETNTWITGIAIANNDPPRAQRLHEMLRDCCGLESGFMHWQQVPRERPLVPRIETAQENLRRLTTPPPDGVVLIHIGRKPVPQPPKPEAPDWLKDLPPWAKERLDIK